MIRDPQRADSESRENPYASPAADFGGPASGDLTDENALALRRGLFGRERAIRRLAWMYLLLAIVWIPAAVGSLFFLALSSLRRAGIDVAPAVRVPARLPTDPGLVILTLFHVGVLSLNIALFYGLRALRSWARWTTVALACAVLLTASVTAYFVRPGPGALAVIFGGGGALVCVIIYVLVSPPSGKLFTREYRDAVARTRGLRL
jgi:hypothetical protein